MFLINNRYALGWAGGVNRYRQLLTLLNDKFSSETFHLPPMNQMIRQNINNTVEPFKNFSNSSNSSNRSRPFINSAIYLSSHRINNHHHLNQNIVIRLFQTKMDEQQQLQSLQAYNQDNDRFENLFQMAFNQMIKDLYENDLGDQSSSMIGFDHQMSIDPLNEMKQWLHKVIDYNLRNGKRNRAKSLVLAYKIFINAQSVNVTEKSLLQACLLGWCVELLQSYLLVVDDIMDDSITRRGQLCWYRKENVGLAAINDGIMLNNLIYLLIKRHFGSSPVYLQLVDLFNEVTRYTAYGQCLDVLSNNNSNQKPNLTKFTNARYNSIVQYKTSYYSFCLPIRLAMYLSDINDPKLHLNAEKILLRIGHLFQVQDDYLDCFGDENITGKIGTDIEDGKCSWLIVQALNLVNDKQRNVIEQNYGVKTVPSMNSIKSLYKELNLEQLFKEYEVNEFNNIRCMINGIENEILSKDVFHNFLSMIYKRNK